ncbi:MAG TPA: alpha/beta hydrolase [Candidatus Binataceae bacterium]
MADTYVLVHGAWHAGWCWAGVIAELEVLGARALAVDLPGHGASTFDRAKVTLPVYVDSVAKFIEDHNLHEVVLAGHSMGGLVIAGVMLKIPRRLKRVIYVTAMVPRDGERPIDSLPPIPDAEASFAAAAARPDLSIPIESLEQQFRANFMQDASRDLQDFVIAALTPQPLRPLAEPVSITDLESAGVPQSYLICDDDISPNGQRGNWNPTFVNRLKNPTTRTIKSGHEVMFTHPVECARALHELAHA